MEPLRLTMEAWRHKMKPSTLTMEAWRHKMESWRLKMEPWRAVDWWSQIRITVMGCRTRIRFRVKKNSPGSATVGEAGHSMLRILTQGVYCLPKGAFSRGGGA
jgi:hypothetical protein